MKRIFIFCFVYLVAQLLYGDTADTISQYGITWYFDKPYEIGTFANGDYWVLGPTTITKITPAFDGTHNGWEINPIYNNPQGFDIRINELRCTFDAKLVPALPITVSGFKSIVKTISEDSTIEKPRPVLKIAAVLTVVSEIPPGRGADVFRPPYVDSLKPFYFIKDIHPELLPQYPPLATMPSLDSMYECFKMVQLDHKDGANSASLRPSENIKGGGYAPTMAMFSNDAILRLMINDSIAQKMSLFIVMLQKGIDMYHYVLSGQVWPDGGGHQPGHVLPMVFTAILLDNENMKKTIRQATFFHEDRLSYSGVNGNGLYGIKDQYWTEQKYWETLVNQSGSNSERDPYCYIDGGYHPGGDDTYLFCCVAQAWKGTALAFQLFPEMKKVWNNSAFFDFSDRWVSRGVWTQPDPCAPPDGICEGGPNNGKPCTLAGGCPQGTCTTSMANYGKTFGPDSKGGCIKDSDSSDGIGRFPFLNKTNIDAGYRSTTFQKAMWNAYRNNTGIIRRRMNFPGNFAHHEYSINYRRSFSSPIAIINSQGRMIHSFAVDRLGNKSRPLSNADLRSLVPADGIYFFLYKQVNRIVLLPTSIVR